MKKSIFRQSFMEITTTSSKIMKSLFFSISLFQICYIIIAQSFIEICVIHQKILSVVNSSLLIYLVPKTLPN